MKIAEIAQEPRPYPRRPLDMLISCPFFCSIKRSLGKAPPWAGFSSEKNFYYFLASVLPSLLLKNFFPLFLKQYVEVLAKAPTFSELE